MSLALLQKGPCHVICIAAHVGRLCTVTEFARLWQDEYTDTQVPILLQANGTSTGHVKAEIPPVAKPVPAIAAIKAEPVPQTAKSDDGKEFLYATKVSHPPTAACVCVSCGRVTSLRVLLVYKQLLHWLAVPNTNIYTCMVGQAGACSHCMPVGSRSSGYLNAYHLIRMSEVSGSSLYTLPVC